MLSTKPWAALVSVAILSSIAGSVITLLAVSFIPGTAINHSDAKVTADSTLSSTQRPSVAALPAAESPSQDQLSAPILARLDTLNQSQESAAQERSQLAASLLQLSRQVDTLESDFINQQSRFAAQSSLSDNTDQTPLTDNTALAGSQSETQDPATRQINQLLAAGIDEQRALSIQQRRDAFQLARLELIDQAEREGWRDSEQFDQQLDVLNQQRVDLREELGESAYDHYLFESGRSNRVIISSVIGGSAADLSGIQVGDLVVRYANERIFTANNLQQATRAGVRGEPVMIEIERNGQRTVAEVPRGPLGVTLQTQTQNPSS